MAAFERVTALAAPQNLVDRPAQAKGGGPDGGVESS